MTMRANVITATMCSVFFVGISFGGPLPDDLLGGPTFSEEEVTQEEMRSRKRQESGKQFVTNPRQQIEMWLSTLRAMKLSSTQGLEVQTIIAEFQSKQVAYQKTYGKELATLRKEFRTKNLDRALALTHSDRMIELLGLVPDVTSYQERAWALFTIDQQNEFRTKYQKLIEEEAKLATNEQE